MLSSVSSLISVSQQEQAGLAGLYAMLEGDLDLAGAHLMWCAASIVLGWRELQESGALEGRSLKVYCITFRVVPHCTWIGRVSHQMKEQKPDNNTRPNQRT